jgi:undecaprenyl pyrophosphate phosphatase UppP
VETVDDMSALDALKVGLLQCLALIPGTSRSGATIIGAHGARLLAPLRHRVQLLPGHPTLMGAGAYSVWKERALLSMADLPMFAVGTVVAFFSALVCIRWLIRFVSTHDFTALCLVPHRVRRPGAADRLDGLGQLERLKTRSHTPWPSLRPRRSNLVSGRQAGRGA